MKEIDPEKLLAMSQKELDQLAKEMNSSPLSDFLGLSPDEVSTLIYPGSQEMTGLLTLSAKFDLGLISKIPALEKALVILKRVSEAGALKGTSRGFLPQKLVREVHITSPLPVDEPEMNITSEGYVLNILALRENLMRCGWLKYERPFFTLTEAGEKIVQNGFTQEDYLLLLKERMFGNDWTHSDLYPEIYFIQQSCYFLCFILFQQNQSFLSYKKLADIYIKAFPTVLEIPEPEDSKFYPESLIVIILSLRFIMRFAFFMGLVELSEKGASSIKELFTENHFRTTKLFREIFKFTPKNKVPFQ